MACAGADAGAPLSAPEETAQTLRPDKDGMRHRPDNSIGFWEIVLTPIESEDLVDAVMRSRHGIERDAFPEALRDAVERSVLHVRRAFDLGQNA